MRNTNSSHGAFFVRLLLLSTLLVVGGLASALAGDCADPEAIEAYETGQEYLQVGRVREGIAEIERAVAIYPDFNEAWNVLNELYGRAGRFDEAIAAVEQLMRLNPVLAEQYQWEIDYYRSLASTPTFAVKALERCQRQDVGSKQAIAACEEAVRIHPDYIDARYLLGVHYIHADEEESAKEQLAALILLDPTGATPILVNAMAMIRPDWLTEAYRIELESLLAAATSVVGRTAPVKGEYKEFSDQDVARILRAYEKQIEALKKLIADPRVIPEACEGYPSTAVTDQLKEQLVPLSFLRILADRENCPTARMYWLLDVLDSAGRPRVNLGLSEITKIATNLGIGNPDKEHWRVGLYQQWLAEKYCKPECFAILEFRIDAEIHGDPIKFRAWIDLLDEVAEVGQCVE